ncbi:MAG: hypothetical protein ACJ72N_09915 [Labedaea sp.]
MYLGAVVELATAITIIATMGEVTANVVRRNPALTAVEWHATVVGQLVPKAAAAGVAVGFWLWMAWAVGRGRRGPRIAFATFFGLNTFSLLDGLAKGSAVYAVTDLAFGLGLWLIELAALVAIFRRADGRVWIRRA